MSRRFRQSVSWVTLAQVVLVGALGTGLHGLFGCEHGPRVCCEQGLCVSACCKADAGTHDCAFCRRSAETSRKAASNDSGAQLTAVDGLACCNGCAVCDLLAQYHNAAPLLLDPLTIELSADEAAIQLHNAVVSAATRLALSRGPPTA